MNWRNMMDTARQLAGQTQPQQPGRPRQEPLKRAVSSAYYAMFHSLCQSNADTIIGRRNDLVSHLAWTRTYRALDHRQAKNRLTQAQRDLPTQAQGFAATFGFMQEQRHAADYNPHSTFVREEVLNLLNAADAATREYMRMPRNERRAVAAVVLLQGRTID